MSRTPRALHNAVADLERALAGRPPESVPQPEGDQTEEQTQPSDAHADHSEDAAANGGSGSGITAG